MPTKWTKVWVQRRQQLDQHSRSDKSAPATTNSTWFICFFIVTMLGGSVGYKPVSLVQLWLGWTTPLTSWNLGILPSKTQKFQDFVGFLCNYSFHTIVLPGTPRPQDLLCQKCCWRSCTSNPLSSSAYAKSWTFRNGWVTGTVMDRQDGANHLVWQGLWGMYAYKWVHILGSI